MVHSTCFKTISIFVKQNSQFLFGTLVSILFMKTIFFFFRGSHALFQNNHKLFSLFVFYPILLFTHKINIIIFFNILHITLCMCVCVCVCCVCCVCMCVCVYVCCLLYFTHGSYLVAVEIYLLFKAHPPHMLLLVRCF